MYPIKSLGWDQNQMYGACLIGRQACREWERGARCCSCGCLGRTFVTMDFSLTVFCGRGLSCRRLDRWVCRLVPGSLVGVVVWYRWLGENRVATFERSPWGISVIFNLAAGGGGSLLACVAATDRGHLAVFGEILSFYSGRVPSPRFPS